jgi:glycosyltransferase involved in cell wall biosynthesis
MGPETIPLTSLMISADKDWANLPDDANRANMLEVATVTTFFPNSTDPNRTVFLKNLVLAMRTMCRLTMIAPVPFAPAVRAVPKWYRRSQVKRLEHIADLEVLHPRFLVVPKFDLFSGITYCLGVAGLLWRLRRRHASLLVHAHCAYPDGVGVALAARLLRLPYVVTAHGSDINVYAERPALRVQMRWALRGANGVIAVSAALGAKIEALTHGATIRLALIPCAGFDPAVFMPRSRPEHLARIGLTPDQRLVVFVGHLVPIKGIGFLIDAWRSLRASSRLTHCDRLVIVGDGPERGAIMRQIASAGLAAEVVLTGAVAQAEVAQWIGAASLLCLPSLNEGTPNVVVEALASGVPVVATRVGGVPDLVHDGVNGMLVEPAQPDALADAIAVALAKHWDPAAIHRSVSNLTWHALAARNCDFLESVSLGPSPSRAGIHA